MQKKKKILQTAMITVALCTCCTLPVYAITEAEVQAQVSSAGREAVTGNLFIWFLCAVAFLKISQKIDSFLSSLGINVGQTRGSMLAEAMLAVRGIQTGMLFTGHRGGWGGHSHSGNSGASPPGSGTFSGGLAGIASRQVTNSATQSVLAPDNNGSGTVMGSRPSGGLGARIYSSSVNRGGSFANSIISNIATGSIREQGSITGDKAPEALMSYMGYRALEEGAQNVPSFSNVEIGGGHITGMETSESHPDGIAFSMYHAGQYTAPQGSYETVQTVDGNSWYKQYAVDTVEKKPYKAPDGSVAYSESIVKKLPPAPARTDRI